MGSHLAVIGFSILFTKSYLCQWVYAYSLLSLQSDSTYLVLCIWFMWNWIFYRVIGMALLSTFSYPAWPAPLFEDTVFSPQCIFGCFFKNLMSIVVYIYVCIFSSVSLIITYVFIPTPWYLYYYSTAIHLGIWMYFSSSLYYLEW